MSDIQKFTFKFGFVDRTIIGGPYHKRFPDHLGIKMAEEINTPCDIDIPTRDFNVPNMETLDMGVRYSLMSIAKNKKVYVGCMGGCGRTGLYFGALAKVLDIPEPIKYVRANFKAHAIETKQQENYITSYKPSLKTRLVASVAKAISLAY